MATEQGGGCEDHGWAASDVVTGWAVTVMVVAISVHSNKGTHDYGSKGIHNYNNGDCPISVTKDAEQGGVATGRRAVVVARCLAEILGWLEGDDARGEDKWWWHGWKQGQQSYKGCRARGSSG
ncbi:hypothetical protein C4D60_Mb09t18230 [Musa balbisiana]|uniref:Uncharacterized protein n=1 Tax=Musa balbisiana TaxID=52838 RepID=A0A4S8IHC6_MUSBA|nr:hypothetical protein C4D60_Mb09t18230 [Musa balbisiana]